MGRLLNLRKGRRQERKRTFSRGRKKEGGKRSRLDASHQEGERGKAILRTPKEKGS